MNQYTVTRTNSITLPFSTGILYKTCNSINGKQKLLLKLVIISLDVSSSEKQRRFGFTFWWQNHSVLIHSNSEDNRQQDDAKFALAPDSLVKEALVTWIESQNEGGVTLLVSVFFLIIRKKLICPFLSKTAIIVTIRWNIARWKKTSYSLRYKFVYLKFGWKFAVQIKTC